MSITKNTAKTKMTIKLKGETGIDQAVKFRDALTEGFKKRDHVVIDFSEVTGVHLSILQLIQSAGNTITDTKKQLSFTGQTNETFQNTLKSYGFIPGDRYKISETKNVFGQQEESHV